MQKEHSPILISQQMIDAPVEKVFEFLRSREGAQILWSAHSTEPLQEHTQSTYKWKVTDFSVTIKTEQVILNRLISTVWPDAVFDFETGPLGCNRTLVTFKAFDFQGTSAELWRIMVEKRSMFSLALKNLKSHFTVPKEKTAERTPAHNPPWK